MTEQATKFSRGGWIDFVSGLPNDFQRPEPSGEGSDLGPPKTAVSAAAVPPEEPGIKVTPLEYSMPNPNSRFGVHPPIDVYESGFPSWVPNDSLYSRIDRKPELA